MKYKIPLFITFSILQVLTSCQDDIKNLDDSDSKSTSTGLLTKSSVDIDGGTLPEVVVVASYTPRVIDDGEYWGGSNNYFDEYFDPRSWWKPIGNGGGGGGGGGGGSGDYNPPITPETVSLSEGLLRMFPKGSDLSKEDLEELNSEYKRMLVHCEFEAITQYMLNNNYCGGKINMRPPAVGSAGIDRRTGDLSFYGSDQINAANLSHEWIHLLQRLLRPDIWEDEFVFAANEGMMEFELVVFLDVIHYMTHGTFERLQPDSDFPSVEQWIENLDIDFPNKKQLKIFYMMWLVETFNDLSKGGDARRIPDKIVDINNYYVLCDRFFQYSRNYSARDFQVNASYGCSTLLEMLKIVAENCFN